MLYEFQLTLLAFGAAADTHPADAGVKNFDVPIVAALVGAVTALVVPFIKDLLIQRMTERRALRRSQEEILRSYLAPLSDACEKLVWRLHEVYVDRRHHWLMKAARPVEYNEYKRSSTLYRIASVLGWIRALTLEINALPRGRAGFGGPIATALRKVQAALADGPDVELRRCGDLCSLWGFDFTSICEDEQTSLATELEVRLYQLAGEELKGHSDSLRELARDTQLNVCFGLADFLAGKFQRAQLDRKVITENLNGAIVRLSYREALIYRDWQDAIGDAVLEKDADSERRYKIVGFDKFEELLRMDRRWMHVFRDCIIDINLDALDPNDFRERQLRKLAIAIAEIIQAIANTKQRDLIGADLLNAANRLTSLPD